MRNERRADRAQSAGPLNNVPALPFYHAAGAGTSRELWRLARLIAGADPDAKCLDDLSGLAKDAARVFLASGLDGLRSWADGNAERDDLLRAVFETDPSAPDPETLELRDRVHWTADDLLKAVFPEPRWAVPGIIPEGLVVLAGRPKVGKSWLALQIAVAVGTGGRVLDTVVERGRVLYLALEDSPRRLQGRLQKQGAPGSAAVEFSTAWPTLGEGGLTCLEKAVASDGFSLIVIDTLSRLLGRSDQLDLAEMTSLLGELQHLSQSKNVTILPIDHHRKRSGLGADPIDDLLGSTAKAAVADAVLALYRERGRQGVTLRVTGRDLEDRALALQWDVVTCCWQYQGDADEVGRSQMQAEILEAIDSLETLGELATGTRIAEQTGRDRTRVAKTIADMLNQGLIAKCDKVGREQPYRRVTHAT